MYKIKIKKHNNSQKTVIKILNENFFTIFKVKIRYIDCLIKQTVIIKKKLTLIIKFIRVINTNKVIKGKLILNSEIHTCKKYIRAC